MAVRLVRWRAALRFAERRLRQAIAAFAGPLRRFGCRHVPAFKNSGCGSSGAIHSAVDVDLDAARTHTLTVVVVGITQGTRVPPSAGVARRLSSFRGFRKEPHSTEPYLVRQSHQLYTDRCRLSG